ncbi:hypothetical protein F4808DRAFT_455564 [Astrocystis sublimbata]|nr:hypothetical protein F4808DRAFT_455564 [Astrocystis sublimbata]
MLILGRRFRPRGSCGVAISSRDLGWFITSQLTILLLCSVATVSGKPTSYFPLNSQLPPVARVSHPFSFSFSPLTFASKKQMTYKLGDGSPSWLSLDSASRALSGTPDEASIPSDETLAGVVITLVASDDTGSTSENATLVVSRNPEPKVQIPLADQIKKFGPYSAPASVLLHPSSGFEFEFDPSTFGLDTAGSGDTQGKVGAAKQDDENNASGPELGLSYYAVSSDNAPLPSWIKFDAGKLSFSGKTPPFESLIQPPQTFGFQLVASDVIGFSSVAVDFSIAVGAHELVADEPVIELNATRGKHLEYTGLAKTFKLDKQPLAPGNISSIQADGLPEWLSFDKDSWAVSGTPDKEAQAKNVTISVVDKFSDALNVTLAVKFDMHSQIFKSDLPELNISTSDDFSFDVKEFLLDPKETQVTTETQPDASWIHFDDSSMILSGTVPETLPKGFANELQIAFNAVRKGTEEKEAKHLSIHVIDNNPTEHDPTPDPKPATKKDDSKRNFLWLLVLPVLVTAFIVILFFFRMRRRREQSRELSKKPDFSEVSRPVPGTLVTNGFTGASLEDIRRLVDSGPPAPYIGSIAPTPRTSSNLKGSQPLSNPNVEEDHESPHAMTTHTDAIGLAIQGPPRLETRNSWFTGRQSRSSPTGTDEDSLLSDTSIGEAVLITQEDMFPNARKPAERASAKIGLAIPTISEPSSVQPTPDLAYMAGRKYDYVSDDERPLAIGLAARRGSGHQRNKSIGSRGVHHRLSKVWKQGSPSKRLGSVKRYSQLSQSTDATARTSILASGPTQEASSNVIARPTVVHIPSRAGEMRRMSRRTNDSITFFGGGSLTGSQRNLRLTRDSLSQPTFLPREDSDLSSDIPEQNEATPADTPDQRERNILGIAYKDLVNTKHANAEDSRSTVAQSENWNTHPSSSSLMSPDRWPIPDAFVGQGSSADKTRDQSEAPQARPDKGKMPSKAEPAGLSINARKAKGSSMRSSQRRASSTPSLSQGSLTHKQSNTKASREERLSICRMREQKALNEFRAMVSTPQVSEEWAQSVPRQLPETPSRPSRQPLADRVNESQGLQSAFSKRSIRTVRSAKSVRSVRAVADDDDDAWEDIRPPESVIGEWDKAGSDGSFPVYI